ncbi:hypothetical protein K7X08_030770 [Anisodus acutangulus]|uniref:Uncharacterized protein n=1 Tax=Anisodus acutangulus TaxID=402998 RepID=A0A9Q1RBK6_9SOLA|nr:hypothetical protein K7X08_030770 [Anisodus acutangulus]
MGSHPISSLLRIRVDPIDFWQPSSSAETSFANFVDIPEHFHTSSPMLNACSSSICADVSSSCDHGSVSICSKP